jgi:hypothetical protein
MILPGRRRNCRLQHHGDNLGGGLDLQNNRQYDVAPAGRFFINTGTEDRSRVDHAADEPESLRARGSARADYSPLVAKCLPGRAPLHPAHWWAHLKQSMISKI